MASKIFGKGTLLQAGDLSTATNFQTVPQCREITLDGFSADQVEVTSHDTPSGFKDKKQGLKDWGTVSTEVIWDPANAVHQQCYDDMVAGTERYWQIVYPDVGNTVFQFKGFVSQFAPKAPIDNVLTAQLQVTILGDPQPTLG